MGLGSYLFLANIFCYYGVSAITNKYFKFTNIYGGIHTRDVGDQAIYGGILLIFVGLYFGYKYLQPVLEQRSLLLEKRNIITYIFWTIFIMYPYIQNKVIDTGKFGLIMVMILNLFFSVRFHSYMSKST